MTCASCGGPMTETALARHGGAVVTIDICPSCHAFWFDKHESLQLAPASTLQLFTMIGEQQKSGRTPIAATLECPRCAARLLPTRDRQRSTAFGYWRCPAEHGRFITFFDFLREKNFVRPLTPAQLKELRENVQVVNCSNCGAPIDLATGSVCPHCASPVSMLDMKHAGEVVEQLRRASEPRPIDPALPLELERARRQVDATFASYGGTKEWWIDASASGLVEAGLGLLTKWMRKG